MGSRACLHQTQYSKGGKETKRSRDAGIHCEESEGFFLRRERPGKIREDTAERGDVGTVSVSERSGIPCTGARRVTRGTRSSAQGPSTQAGISTVAGTLCTQETPDTQEALSA